MPPRRFLHIFATCTVLALATACGDDPVPARNAADSAASVDASTVADVAPPDLAVDTAAPEAVADAVPAGNGEEAVDGGSPTETASADAAVPPQCQVAADCVPTGNPCILPACTAKGSCATVSAEGLGCDDGQPCTIAAYCKAGKCVAKLSAACECTGNADCAALEDGNLCDGTL